jgi:hypothetical protein
VKLQMFVVEIAPLHGGQKTCGGVSATLALQIAIDRFRYR